MLISWQIAGIFLFSLKDTMSKCGAKDCFTEYNIVKKNGEDTMKILYIVLAATALLVILGILFVLFRRHRAKSRVRRRGDEQKIRDLNNAISPFGFLYDICQDVFYAAKDGWQRELGYGRIYDENAIRLNMVIDCEPLYFTYDGKGYLLELWKGQYGMTTGAEIGLYISDEVDTEHPEKLFYKSVSDDEMLGMRFVLRKKGRILMLRDERHWWLTGFVLGEFSKPEELGMEISISFPNQRMRNAVYDALIKAGYDRENIFADGLRLRFGFTKPRTVQPKHLRIRVKWVQWKNKRFCKKYLRVTKSFVRTIDRVDYLGMCFPRLYRLLGKLNRQKKR